MIFADAHLSRSESGLSSPQKAFYSRKTSLPNLKSPKEKAKLTRNAKNSNKIQAQTLKKVAKNSSKIHKSSQKAAKRQRRYNDKASKNSATMFRFEMMSNFLPLNSKQSLFECRHSRFAPVKKRRSSSLILPSKSRSICGFFSP